MRVGVMTWTASRAILKILWHTILQAELHSDPDPLVYCSETQILGSN